METNERRPLFGGIIAFRVTPEDCDWQMVESDVLCIHTPSGARGVAQDRNQAFMRALETDAFKNWHRAERERQQSKMFGGDEFAAGSDEMYDWQVTENGVRRCIHRTSGATGEGPDRFQAWKRMTETDVFKQWRKAEAWRRWGHLCKCGEARGKSRRDCPNTGPDLMWHDRPEIGKLPRPCRCFCHEE